MKLSLMQEMSLIGKASFQALQHHRIEKTSSCKYQSPYQSPYVNVPLKYV